MTTGRPASRAAVSLGAVAAPPLSLVTTTSMRCRPQQLAFVLQGEGAAGEQGFHPGRVRGLGGVHGAHEEPEVRQVGEVGEAHAAGGEEDAAAQGGEGRGGLVQGADPVPGVAPGRDPAGPAEGQQGNMGGGGGLCRVETDRAGERMGGVDERVHRVLAQPAGEALGASEPSDAHVPRRQPGRGDPAREGGRDPRRGRCARSGRRPAGGPRSCRRGSAHGGGPAGAWASSFTSGGSFHG